MSIEVGNKIPSQTLELLMTDAASSLTNFAHLWKQILEVGVSEGFTKAELEFMMKPYLLDNMKGLGLEPKQLENKLYYIFKKDQIKERQKQNKSLKIQENDDNNDTEECSSNNEEFENLKLENQELQRKLDNATFSDNPDIFEMNKNIEPGEKEGFIDMANGIEAMGLLKLYLRKENKYQVAWRAVV